MKAISLWQPWASAVANGSKLIETRSWATSYRGPLAIHAASRRNIEELSYYGACWNWCGALGVVMGCAKLYDTLPFGAIVAVVELVDCRPTDSFTVGQLDRGRHCSTNVYCWTERQMGDFTPGRFGWVFTKPRKLPKPIPFKGRQRLFYIPGNLIPL